MTETRRLAPPAAPMSAAPRLPQAPLPCRLRPNRSMSAGRPRTPGERLTNPNVGLERASRARLASGLDRVGLSFRSSYGDAVLMSSTLSPVSSPNVRRRGSTRRPRAYSHLPPYSLESHESALAAIRAYLKGRTCYDTFPVSFRLIVLDSKLEVKKALQCLLINGAYVLIPPWPPLIPYIPQGVVSAPLWNSEKSCFAGMFTVSDIIHLIQYYYKCSSYDAAASDVETFRLESLRGACFLCPFSHAINLTSDQTLRSN